MKRSLAIILALIGILASAGSVAASHVGTTTINLRAWHGTQPVDGVVVCVEQRGHHLTCGATEDGELWVDSLPHGTYRAWIEPAAGWDLTGITCTSYPDIEYSPCRVRGSEVRFRVRQDTVAVNINFNLAAS